MLAWLRISYGDFSMSTRSFFFFWLVVLANSTAMVADSFSITQARLPIDLPAISDCRRDVMSSSSSTAPWVSPSFYSAAAVAAGRTRCWVALEEEPQQQDSHRYLDHPYIPTTSTTPVVLGCVEYNPGTRRINNLMVRPMARGRGIARHLMQMVEKEVVGNTGATTTTVQNDKQSAGRLHLDVYTNNMPAIRLYESLGYQPNGPLNACVAWLGERIGIGFLVEYVKHAEPQDVESIATPFVQTASSKNQTKETVWVL